METGAKKVIQIYGAWVLVWLVIAAYGVLFTGHGEFGVTSHLWLTITGLPLSLISWFITPHGTFIGSLVAGVIGLAQWIAVAEANSRWDKWCKLKNK